MEIVFSFRQDIFRIGQKSRTVMTALSCPIFRKNNVFSKEEMMKFRLVGQEDIRSDLTEHAGWNGKSKLFTLLLF